MGCEKGRVERGGGRRAFGADIRPSWSYTRLCSMPVGSRRLVGLAALGVRSRAENGLASCAAFACGRLLDSQSVECLQVGVVEAEFLAVVEGALWRKFACQEEAPYAVWGSAWIPRPRRVLDDATREPQALFSADEGLSKPSRNDGGYGNDGQNRGKVDRRRIGY